MDKSFKCDGWGQIVAILSATLTVISDGVHYGWTSSSIIILQQKDSPVGIITVKEQYWLETFLWIGGASGIPVTLLTTSKLGRKWSIVICSIQNLITWIMIACANDVRIMYAARFLAGLAGNTAFVAIPMYIAECSDAKMRGFLGTMIFTMMITGTVLGYAIVPFVPIWKSSIIGIVVHTVHIATYSWMPESPYFYLLKKKREKAEKSLKWLRSKDDVEDELQSIIVAVERQSSERGRPWDLFLVASNRKGLFIMTWLNLTQHMSAISVIHMNVQPIFIASGSPLEPHYASVIFGCVMLVSVLFGSLLIDKFGRKVLLIVSLILTVIVLATLGGYFLAMKLGYDPKTWIPFASLIGYAFANRIGLGLVPIIMIGEVFPTSVKVLGMTLVDLTYMIFAIISIKLYFWTTKKWGQHVPFLFFAAWGILAIIVIALFFPETKGLTLEQIQMKLKGKNVKDVLNSEDLKRDKLKYKNSKKDKTEIEKSKNPEKNEPK